MAERHGDTTNLAGEGAEAPGFNVTSAQEQHLVSETGISAFADTAVSGVTEDTSVDVVDRVYPDQGLTPVLSRSYLIETVAWLSTDTRGAVVFDQVFPDYVLDTLALGNYVDKLKTFSYMTIDATTITLRLQTNMMFYGRLLAAIIPMPRADNFPTMTDASDLVRALSFYPCQVLSAQSEPVIEFDVPWIYPKSRWNLHDVAGTPYINAFRLKVVVLEPLRCSSALTSQSCELAIFHAWKNPRPEGLVVSHGDARDWRELYPTGGVNSYPIGLPTMDSAGWYPYLNCDIRSWDRRVPHSLTMAFAHGLRRKKRKVNIAQKEAEPSDEQKARSEGIVSGTANRVAEIADMWASVPIVGGVASAVSGPAKLVGKIAGMFGFSKPLDLGAQRRMYSMSFPYMSTARDLGNELPLPRFDAAATQSTTLDLFGDNGQCYMDIDTFCRLPVVLKTGVDVASTDGDGDVIFAWHNTPMCYNAAQTANEHIFSYAALPGMYCSAWQGGMKYTLMVSAGKMTSARLAIVVIPGGDHTIGSFNLSYLGDYYTRYIDVVGDIEYNFTIPYLSDFPMLTTEYLVASTHNQAEAMKSLQTIYIVLVNKLTSPADVPPSMAITLWGAAAEDMTYHGLRGLWRNYGAVSHSTWGYSYDGTSFLTLQEGTLTANVLSKKDKVKQRVQFAQAHWNPRAIYKDTFETLLSDTRATKPPDIMFGERFLSWKDIWLRMRAMPAAVSSSLTTFPDTVLNDVTALSSLPFRLWRYEWVLYCHATSDVFLATRFPYNDSEFLQPVPPPYATGQIYLNSTVNDGCVEISLPRNAITNFDVNSGAGSTALENPVGSNPTDGQTVGARPMLNTDSVGAIALRLGDASVAGFPQFPGIWKYTAPV